MVKILFSNVCLEFPTFQLVPIALVLSLCTSKKNISIFSKPCDQRVADSNKVSPSLFLLQGGQTQLSQPLLVHHVLQPSCQLCAPPLNLSSHINILLVLEIPKLDTVVQIWSYKCQTEGKDFSWPAGSVPPNKAQDVAGFHCLKGTALHVQHAVHYDPQMFFCRAVSYQSATSLHHRIKLLHPRCKTLCLFLLNLSSFLSACFFSLFLLFTSLWTAVLPSRVWTAPPNVVSSANLLRVRSIPSSRSLMKTLNSMVPVLIPEGSP